MKKTAIKKWQKFIILLASEDESNSCYSHLCKWKINITIYGVPFNCVMGVFDGLSKVKD